MDRPRTSPLPHSSTPLRILVVYDIAEPRLRARMARALEGAGVRVQKSVFEADLSGTEIRALLARLQRLVDRASAPCSVRLYPLCNACAARVHLLGDGPPLHHEPEFYLV